MTEQAFTVEQFVSAYKIGRTKAFHEISQGRLATYKVGHRRYISTRAAAEWQQRLEAAAIASTDSQAVSA